MKRKQKQFHKGENTRKAKKKIQHCKEHLSEMCFLKRWWVFLFLSQFPICTSLIPLVDSRLHVSVPHTKNSSGGDDGRHEERGVRWQAFNKLRRPYFWCVCLNRPQRWFIICQFSLKMFVSYPRVIYTHFTLFRLPGFCWRLSQLF